MKNDLLIRVMAATALAATACSDDKSGGGATITGGTTITAGTAMTAGDDGATTDPTAGTTDPTGATTMPTTSGDGSGGTDGTSGDSGGSFIQEPDGGGTDIECDVWAQDCADGEKCMPWANDGGNSWNATKCSPVNPNPGQPGDACTVEGNGVAGVDSCDVAAMCWDVDPMTNMGTCLAFCNGDANNPTCDDPSTVCSITNDGVLILCLPTCDPLLQDCPDGQACYPIPNGLACAPDSSGPDMGMAGDPCEFINACDPGTACMAAMGVPGCTGANSCCAPFCDLSEMPDPCASMGGGVACTALYDMPGPGQENIGVCIIPM